MGFFCVSNNSNSNSNSLDLFVERRSGASVYQRIQPAVEYELKDGVVISSPLLCMFKVRLEQPPVSLSVAISFESCLTRARVGGTSADRGVEGGVCSTTCSLQPQPPHKPATPFPRPRSRSIENTSRRSRLSSAAPECQRAGGEFVRREGLSSAKAQTVRPLRSLPPPRPL